MAAFGNIYRAGKKIYEEGKAGRGKSPAQDAMTPRQQRRAEPVRTPAPKAPANRDARLMGDTMGGMMGKAQGALKTRRQRIDDAVDEAVSGKKRR